jgi:hypothetical protein
MTEEQNRSALILIVIKYITLNVGAYIISDYDKILGALFTALSIVYVCFKLWNEFLKPKKNENK